METGPGTTHFARLLDRIRSGDTSARDELIRDAYRRVHRRAHYILRGSFPNAMSIETDDVVSLSLENFARKIGAGIESMFETPAGALRLCRRRHPSRHHRRDPPRAGPCFRTQFPDAQVPDGMTDARTRPFGNGVLLRLSYEELVESLPEAEQHLINFRYIREMTVEEIASVLGESRKSVGRRLRAILLKLRAELKGLESGENS